MSEVATAITTELVRYLAAHAAEEDAFLKGLRQEAAAAKIPNIAISPEQGTLVQILLRLMGARTVVEVGTLYGYSAISMARALGADGMVHTLEINPAYADFAQRSIARSDVAGRVTIHRGDAATLLAGFKDGSADAVFIDADKANSMLYYQQAKRIARAGGLVMIDNAFAYGQLLDENPSRKDDVWAIRKFNDFMAHDRSLTSVIVPTGDGMWVGLKSGG